MLSLQAKVTEFGINKENMFEFWDVSFSYMYNHCFLKQTGREGGNPKNITRSKKLIHSNNHMKGGGEEPWYPSFGGNTDSDRKHQSNVCNLFCFSVSSGLEDVTPCGLPLVSPSPSPSAWTTLRGCLLEHTLWYVLITEETWVDSILCFYKRQEASALFLVDIKNWSGLGVRLLGTVRMQYWPKRWIGAVDQLTEL